jgi:hypothetical protein
MFLIVLDRLGIVHGWIEAHADIPVGALRGQMTRYSAYAMLNILLLFSSTKSLTAIYWHQWLSTELC